MIQGDALCDGSLSSFIEVGVKVVLQKLLHHDMDTVVTMLTNMVGWNTKESRHLQLTTNLSVDSYELIWLCPTVEDLNNFVLIQVFHVMVPFGKKVFGEVFTSFLRHFWLIPFLLIAQNLSNVAGGGGGSIAMVTTLPGNLTINMLTLLNVLVFDL